MGLARPAAALCLHRTVPQRLEQHEVVSSVVCTALCKFLVIYGSPRDAGSIIQTFERFELRHYIFSTKEIDFRNSSRLQHLHLYYYYVVLL